MGRKPSNGGPSFRFNNSEVAEMESILQENDIQVPGRDVLAGLAEKFSNMPERVGKVEVQIKQVWNWFQNRRYALRAKAGNLRSVLHSIRPHAALSVQGEANNVPENPLMEFEARSARDGAWYDVACFLSHRSLETGDPEVLVRFSGFGPEEDEWVNVRKHIRQRSLPCESSECVAVLPGDLILCFQEGKEQALYFDAHVLDSQRRRHDARGCRCRFLVRYDHDQSEEIVPLRKICRRPENDYRLQSLHAESAKVYQQRAGPDIHSSNPGKGHAPAEPTKEQIQVDAGAGSTTKTPVGTVAPEILSAAVCHAAAATPNQTSLPVLGYPKVSPEITQSQHSSKTNADTVERQLFSAAVGQVPATPTQAESLELIESQDTAETHANTVLTQIIPGTEGHVVAVDSTTPAQISLPEPGEPKEMLETTHPQYPADQIMPTTEGHEVALSAAISLRSLPEASKSKESFETLMVPTTGPGAAVSTQISLPKPSESEVSLETTQPQLSADQQMLPETEGHGAALVTATPSQASHPKPGESELLLDTLPPRHSTEPSADTLATQILPTTEFHETVVEARTLAQIQLPEPNESKVLLETSQQPHSEQTPDHSVRAPILSLTAAVTPTQASLSELTDTGMPLGESQL